MFCQPNCEYAFEDMHKCAFCNNFIDGKFSRVIYRNKRFYYHPVCFELFRAKMNNFF